MKSPNNPYNINDVLPTLITSPIKTDEISDWYLEQIYQIEIELKSQYLDKEYKQYLIKKHNFLLIGLKSFLNSVSI